MTVEVYGWVRIPPELADEEALRAIADSVCRKNAPNPGDLLRWRVDTTLPGLREDTRLVAYFEESTT